MMYSVHDVKNEWSIFTLFSFRVKSFRVSVSGTDSDPDPDVFTEPKLV